MPTIQSPQSRRKTERLINLLLLLSNTPRPLTRAEIFAGLPDHYPDDSAATQRKFERDKRELKSIVDVQTFGDESSAESSGYGIDRRLAQESDLELTAAEAAVVAIAVQQGFSGEEARALGIATDGLAASGGNVEMMRDSLDISPLPSRLRSCMSAFRSRQRVAFDYLKPGDSHPRRRRLDIWAIQAHNGHWYVGGWDVDTCDRRVFRVDRFASTVEAEGDSAFRRPRDYDIELEIMREQAEVPFATVKLRPGKCWQLRRRGTLTGSTDEGWDEVQLDCRDIDGTAGLLARYGSDAVVISPPDLREKVIARLRAAELGGGRA